MDDEFTLAAASRLDGLEDLVGKARENLTEPLYADDVDDYLRMCERAASGMLALIELRESADALLKATANNYKIRAEA